MAYIGRNPAIGTQKVLDSLESQFNGNLTTFNLRYNSNTIYPPIASALIVSLGGVLQEPGVAYTVTSDTITFATAPPTGTDCWILLYTEFGAAGGGSANFTVSNNLTIGNELHGPANFVIDPSTIGDNTGTVEIKGNLTVQGTQTTVNSTTVDLDHLSLGDNEIANFGDNNDLKIYHSGSNSQIRDEGAGRLFFASNGEGFGFIKVGGEAIANLYTDGAVELYYDNSLKFQTTNTGIDVTGLIDTDTLNVSSTSTFTGSISLPDSSGDTVGRALFGDSDDLRIYHDGNNSIIQEVGAGDLRLSGNVVKLNNGNNTATMVKGSDGGSVELYHNGSKKLETGQFGVDVTGSLAASNIELEDNGRLLIGTSDDLQIYHSGANSYIQDGGTGALIFKSNIYSFRNAADSEQIARFDENGSVELYYDNSPKFETTSTGVDITGLTDTDTLNVSGSSTFNGNTKHFDGKYANFGNNTDLQIVHDGNNSVIQNATGQFFIDNNASGGDLFLRANDDVVIRIDGNDTVLTARTGGVTITGALEVAAATNLTVGGTSLPSLTGLLGGSLSGTLGAVTMAYLPSAPSSPVQGQFYFNSLNQKAQIYTGSAFVDLVPSGGGGGGGGGGSSTDANATFRKYTYSISSTTNSITGSSDTVVSAGSFIVGYKYTIKTVGTTDFTAIGASANTVGVVFTATGAGSGSGDAFDTLFYSTGGDQNVEVYVNGVKAVEGSTNDYVATSGTSVNLVANVTSGDVVEIQVYELLTNDAFVLATGGTFTGNVGINTSTINNRLHIHSNANEQGILLTQGGDNFSSIISNTNRTQADRFILEILAKWNGSEAAQISLETGNDTTNKDDGKIKFWTSNSGGAGLNVRMQIDPAGTVGIGIPDNTDAVARLDVKGTGNIPTGIHNYAYASGEGIRVAGIESAIDIVGEDAGQHGASLLLRNENEGFSIHNRPDTDSLHFRSFTSSADSFSIHDDNNVSASVNIMSFLKAGNVGMGSTQPTVKLDVAGSAKFVNSFPGNTHVLMQDGGSATPLKTATTLRVINDGNSSNYSTVEFESGSGKFIMLNNGHIGVGTASPARILHVGTTDSSAQVLVTGTTPQFRLSDLAADGTDANRAIFGLATAAGHFFSTAVAGDAALRSPEDKSLLFGIGVTERARLDDTGFKVAWNSSSAEGQVPLMLGVSAVDALDTGAGAACTGVLRIKDNGGTNNRYHGIDLRNKNSGDVRIMNQDTGTTNQADLVFGVDKNNTDGIVEIMRFTGSNSRVSVGGSAGGVGTKFNIFNRSDNDNIFGITGADEGSEYAAIGVRAGYAVITGGGAGSTSTGLMFRTADAGTETDRFSISPTGVIQLSNISSAYTSGTATRFSLYNDINNHYGLHVGVAFDLNYNAGGSVASGKGQHVFHTAAQERLRINGLGNVGVGTNNPTQKLDVNGALAIYKRGGTDSTRLIMENSGANLAASARIEFWEGTHVGAAANAANAAIEYDGTTSYGGDGAILIKGYTTGADQVLAGFSRSGTTHFAGNVGIGTTDPSNGLGAAANPSLSVYNGSGARLGLWGNGSRWWYIHGEDSNALQSGARTSSNTVDSDYLTISTTGNVGIGTNNPEARLHLRGGADSQFIFETTTTANAATGGPVITLGESTSEVGVSGGIAFVENITTSGNNTDVTMGLYYNGISNYFAITGQSSTASTVGANLRAASHHFVVKRDDGNIGIGTASPQSKLDIYGGSGAIWLHKTSNGGGIGINFSDHSGSNPAYAQKGYLRFYHSDGESFGHNAAFAFTTTETAAPTNGSFTVYSSDDFTAVGTLTENYSDERLKTIHGRIDNPLEKLSKIHGYYYTQNETADELGFKEKGQRQVGVSAQEIQEVLPEVIRVAPISYTDKTDEEYYTVQYNRVVPLLIESIKAQQELIEKLQQRLDDAGL